MMTQKQRILKHLTFYDGASITSIWAFQKFGITCLHKRISELREDGHKISDTMIAVKNRYGQKCRVKMFWLTRGRK